MYSYDPSQTYASGGMAAQNPLLANALQGGGIQHPLLALGALQSQFGGGIQHPLLALAALQSQLGGGGQQSPFGGGIGGGQQSPFGGGIQHPLLALAALQSQLGGGGQQSPFGGGMQNPLAPQTMMGQGGWGGGRGW